MMHRTLTLTALLFLPSLALADAGFDLVDADFEDPIEDFSTDRGTGTTSSIQPSLDIDSMDEDPEWDMPEEDDIALEEDPSWDVDPEIGTGLGDPFADEDDFTIPQTAPEPVAEEDPEEEEALALPEAKNTGIKNADPGLDLSIFDIED